MLNTHLKSASATSASELRLNTHLKSTGAAEMAKEDAGECGGGGERSFLNAQTGEKINVGF